MLMQICPAGHGMLVLRHSLISTRAQVSITLSGLKKFKVRSSHYVTLQRKVLPVAEDIFMTFNFTDTILPE